MTWVLHHTPHRHYKYTDPATGKTSWNIRGQRIISVTAALDESGDRLWKWAVGQAYLAAEHLTGQTQLPDAAWSAGMGPEAIRDKAALLGTASHAGLAEMARGSWRGAKLEAHARAASLAYDRLRVIEEEGVEPPVVTEQDLWPRFVALEDFWRTHYPVTAACEQVVGSVKHAYAGTFDWAGTLDGYRGLVLLDAKNTNMPSWRHPVQVAAYEMARREMGYEPARHLLVLYLTPYGTFKLFDVSRLGGYASCRQAFLQQLSLSRKQRNIDRLITKMEKTT
jgi:hypothetical protein